MSQSLAKLTSTSTQTLSLLLERERAQTFAGENAGQTGLHGAKITRNLQQLRAGLLALEASDGSSEASKLLRGQYERMRQMLGEDGADLEPLVSAAPSPAPTTPESDDGPFRDEPTPSRDIPQKARDRLGLDDGNGEGFAPYADDPERGPEEPSSSQMLHQQRQLMDEQDVHLDALARSISRQHGLSTQINDELETHSGLLHSLDTDIDDTNNNLTRARRRLNTFARGVKGNASTVTIAMLIAVLLVLILWFKT